MRHRWERHGRIAGPNIGRPKRCKKCGLRRKFVMRPRSGIVGALGARVRVAEYRWPGGKWEEKKMPPCFGGSRGDSK